MKPKETGFYRHGLSPKDRAEMERLAEELAAEKQRNDELETAAVELADLAATHDEALVELAGMIGG